jgi:hypothetical protein
MHTKIEDQGQVATGTCPVSNPAVGGFGSWVVGAY